MNSNKYIMSCDVDTSIEMANHLRIKMVLTIKKNVNLTNFYIRSSKKHNLFKYLKIHLLVIFYNVHNEILWWGE